MKVILIEPRREFGSPAGAVRLSEAEEEDSVHMHLFDVHILAMLVEDNGMPHAFACSFLSNVALTSRSVTGDTVRTYAEALVPWLLFLRKKGIPLLSVTEEHLGHYRNFIVNASKQDGRSRYASTTANHRVVVAALFHIWGQRSDAMPSELGKYLWDRQMQLRGNIWPGLAYSRGPADPILPRVILRLPRVLSLEELSRFFIVAPLEYKLMFRWAVATGMRRFEICNLAISTLPTADQIAVRGLELVPIEVLRKGARLRTVQAPSRLVEETLWYMATERPSPVDRLYSDFVFLTRRGRPYARAALSRTFRRCAKMVGSDATLHHLRHTFAVHVLAALESDEHRDKAMNSMKILQILMGHSNVTTTEIYLQAVEANSDAVCDILDFLYGAAI